jgi:radical SAM protein with 4Fe4S-binding SPASM domain
MNGGSNADTVPVWLWIDPTRACNLKCKFCYAVPSHRDEHLSPERLRFFLRRLFEDEQFVVQKLHLNWRGDPSMNPQLPALLAEVESIAPDFPWELHTNGILIDLKFATQITSVLKTGQIFVSVDGGTAQSHDANRGEGSFRKALAGLRCLLEARGFGVVPHIGLYQLDLGEDPALYDVEFSSLVAKVDTWASVYPVHPKNGGRLDFQSATRPFIRSVGPDRTRTAEDRWWTGASLESHHMPHGPCFWAGNAFFVAPDGDVSVCLVSHSSEGVVGNLLRQPFSEIVDRARSFRASLTERGRALTPHCAKCRMAEGQPRAAISRSARV